MNRLTKIVCTLGPSTSDFKSIKELIDSGMDFARLNFSHGNYEEHMSRIYILKKLSKNGKKIKILQDLPGPKIRVGKIDGQIILKDGAEIKLTTAQEDELSIPVMYKQLPESVSVGSDVLLCDGAIKLKVLETGRDYVLCKVETGGTVISHKGVNITGTTSKVSAITKEDIKHIKFGAKQNVDYIAVSFVNRAKDIEFAKSIISKTGKEIPVIAKIEKKEAIENIDSIIKASDAVMVARGDLAVEIGFENVPLAQKLIIKRANALGKPVITATQMLLSMVNNSTPTRAEVSDIANAIIDGTDALMLSEETTVGKYPQKAVGVLNKVATRMEIESNIRARLTKRNNLFYKRFLQP
jgi:pyruvate kinase